MIIKGFWHIWLQAHWYSVVSDQMRILLTSGLYDACDEINIGCIGSPAEKAVLEKYFVSLYPKLKIRYHSERAEDYEFPTLRLIENDNSKYAGFYFHTKAVSKPFESVINHWRACLDEEILNRWQRHYENICNGYDVSSMNHMSGPDHFSGNFWWFNREYIKRLPRIDSLNHEYRWDAEQWICKSPGKYYFPEFIEPADNTFLMNYKNKTMEYIPKVLDNPRTILQGLSAWGKIPQILKDIIVRFNLDTDVALEFGVATGYSTSALANYFKKVIGVDPFDSTESYSSVKESLKDYSNILLIEGLFESFIATERGIYDLIHVDVGYFDHNYKTTYPCGEWSVQHSDCVLFHDTISYPEIKKVCEELAEKYNFEFYNYLYDNGLGILIKKVK